MTSLASSSGFAFVRPGFMAVLTLAIVLWAFAGFDASAQMDYMEPVKITPSQLMKAYKTNFHKADADYTGKLLILTGRIRTIAPPRHPYSRNDYPFVTMDAGAGSQPVVVYFWEWDADKLSKLKAGATLSVMGFCEGVLPQMSLNGACIYPSGCGGPKANFYGPHYKLPPSAPFNK